MNTGDLVRWDISTMSGIKEAVGLVLEVMPQGKARVQWVTHPGLRGLPPPTKPAIVYINNCEVLSEGR